MSQLHPDELFAIERKLALMEPNEVVWLLAKHLPYVGAIETEVKKLNGYGRVEARFDVRAGAINKAEFISIATWIKDKSEKTT